MNIEDLYKKSKTLAAGSGRTSHGIRHSDLLYLNMLKVAEDNRLTIGQAYDMALFSFLDAIEKIDMTGFKEVVAQPKKEVKAKSTSKQCGDCFYVYDTSKHSACPHCSKT